MARVTIEDCKANRYELVVLAAFRAKQIAAGNLPLVPRDNDKDAVVALREIAADKVKIDELREAAIKKEQIFKILSPQGYEDSNAQQSGNQLEIQKEMNSYQDIVISKDETLQGFYHENEEDLEDETIVGEEE